MLIAQDVPSIEIYRRTDAGWKSIMQQGIDTLIEFRSIELEIRLARIYA